MASILAGVASAASAVKGAAVAASCFSTQAQDPSSARVESTGTHDAGSARAQTWAEQAARVLWLSSTLTLVRLRLRQQSCTRRATHADRSAG